ncbi:PREDICTED: ras-specific guanine nucleotide-releasing factor 1, partial [Myotis brandtii]|uniref:ras-specific guanine nucleotide-releasing factor 1 n=1 Tax=Myotis brandtii TaxID=109478 RepID=UPI00070412BD
MQKGIRLNDGHVASLGLLARQDGTRKGYLSKRSADNTKWQTKWFALLHNLLFYFESDSSTRPSGLYLLEGCVCDRAPSPKPALSAKEPPEKQHYFTVNFSHENQKALELRTEDAKDRDEWVAAIAHASYRALATEHEALMQKYLHLLQIVETEKTVAKQLRRQIEDGEVEIERLKAEIASLLKDNERIQSTQTTVTSDPGDEDSDIKKIKKVQSFLRGWLCRRKWKTVIQDYIRSPHADSMRKRNQLVFSMLEAEAEYVQQLHILVNNFLRPLRMAASSKRPPITHDDVSSIFPSSETIMFLHQIFYQGLKARISNWPTLVLADLFDILLPMLNIYQEFVRNHQYSLQILAHCKQNRDFDKLLKHYEAKPDCEERTLETFLTYPMFQVRPPTPIPGVSSPPTSQRIMHDEVSETENIRKNLAIERMIIEGCEILLDTSQTFVRQGSLIQVPMSEKGKIPRGRLGSLSLRKEGERQCFLFSKHLIICTRGSGGKLHLTKNGVVSLIECTLLEDPESTEEEAKGSGQDMDHLDFKIGVEPKEAPPFTVILVASSRQEKAAWTSDISQCVDNIRCNGLMMNAFEENSKVTVPQMINPSVKLGPPLSKGPPKREPTSPTCKGGGARGSRSPFRHGDPHTNSVSSGTTGPNPKIGDRLGDVRPSPPLPGSDVSVREESDTDQNQSDEADPETSPTKSPTTPKPVRSKNPSEFPLFSYNNGVVMRSCRELDNSRSGLSAASAFAIATSGANEGTPNKEKYRRMSLASTAGTPQAAGTPRAAGTEWPQPSSLPQDFETNKELKSKVVGFLEEVTRNPELLTQERKAAANTDSSSPRLAPRTLTQEDPGDNQITLEEITQLAAGVKAEPFENHSALEIAEQLTLLDHLVFKKIPYEEFFGQGWMKLEKNERTPYIMKTTKHFNDISNLIASEIIRNEDISARASAIEKWVAVADICRCLHNYNAVLEITSSMNRSAIFRLKKTWLKVSKQTKALIDKLQKLVSSDGRFKNLREALKNCDPPCVPYLGMYLTDLAFIEEGTPNYTEDGLVNFSKMRMISHIIREIRQFQQTAYKIEHQAKVTQYLLDRSFVMDEESLYEAS